MDSKYSYTSPEIEIKSLELAYDNEDLNGILKSKDFESEAILIIRKTGLIESTELIKETSDALKLSLIKNLTQNGYPYFGQLKRTFSELSQIDDNLFKIEETIDSENIQTTYEVYLSEKNGMWKVAMINPLK